MFLPHVITAAILVAIFALSFQQQCNNVTFDPQLQICCDGVLKSPPETEIAAYFYECCGGKIYRTDELKCCNETLYNATTQFCYNETVLEKSDADSIFNCGEEQTDFGQFSCCGGAAVELDRFKKLCCNNQVFVNDKGDFYYPECCGSIMIFRVNQICCEGNAFNFTVNEFTQCCGDKKFGAFTEDCVDGVIHPK